MRRSMELKCCSTCRSAEEELGGRSRYRPDLLLPTDPNKRLLWLSESARSYGASPQLPCHLPAAYYPADRVFSKAGYAGKRQSAGLSTAINRSRIHKSLEGFGGV